VDLSFKTWGGRLFYAGLTATCIVALAFLLRSDDALTVAFLVGMWLAFSLVMFLVLSYAYFTYAWFIPNYVDWNGLRSRRRLIFAVLYTTGWCALYAWLSPHWFHTPVKLGGVIIMWLFGLGFQVFIKVPERRPSRA
jgi:hypothetical protein